MRGSCHCGKVSIEVASAPVELASCNCSVCRRLAPLMAYYRPDEVRIEPAGETEPYIWGDKCIAIHHCRTCGCLTHWEALIPDLDRMGVNARMFDDLDLDSIPIRKVDGASY